MSSRTSCSAESIFAAELKTVLAYIDAGYSGKGWDHHDKDLGPIFWPIESAGWLRLTRDQPALQRATREFVETLGLDDDPELIDDLCSFHVYLLSDRTVTDPEFAAEFSYDWRAWCLDRETPLPERRTTRYSYPNPLTENWQGFEWNKRAIWWGRRSRKFKALPLELSVV